MTRSIYKCMSYAYNEVKTHSILSYVQLKGKTDGEVATICSVP